MEKLHVWTYLFQNYVFSSLFPNSAPKKYEVLSKSKTASTYTEGTLADLSPDHFSSHKPALNCV